MNMRRSPGEDLQNYSGCARIGRHARRPGYATTSAALAEDTPTTVETTTDQSVTTANETTGDGNATDNVGTDNAGDTSVDPTALNPIPTLVRIPA